MRPIGRRHTEIVGVEKGGVPRDRGFGALSDGQSGRLSKRDPDVPPAQALGDQNALLGTRKEVSFVRAEHFMDLDVYIEHLRVVLRKTFLSLVAIKHRINFCVCSV